MPFPQWHAQCPDLDVSPMAVFSHRFRLHTLATREVDTAVRQHGLHQGEFDVLAREPNPDDRRGVMVSLTPKGLRAGGKP